MTSVHSREDIRVFLKECRSLADAGDEVFLVVADGKGEEVKGGVHILDVGSPRGRMERMLKTVRRVYRAARKLDADVYHFHDPELLLVALKLKKLENKPFVLYDTHEDLPRQILGKHWIPVVLRRFVAFVVARVENHVARRLSGIVAATPGIAKRFERLNSNTINVNNYPLPLEFSPSHLGGIRKNRQICYVGEISRIRGLKEVIQALDLVPDVKFVLCGTFMEPNHKEELETLRGWRQVDYRGRVDRTEVGNVLCESSAGIVTFYPGPNHTEAQPNKMFEYMSAELPVIASDFPHWKEIIEGSQCGLCVDPLSPRAIAEAIRFMVDNPDKVKVMGKNGRNAIMEKYNWPNEASKLISFYGSLGAIS